MLQQTQVDRVKGFYRRFVRQYPSFEDLAAADEPPVREAWEGLGYYARARNLHAHRPRRGRRARRPAARRCRRRSASLPGIGRYTAGAVLSIAYGKDEPILDTNAARVLQRVFGVRVRGGNGAPAAAACGTRRARHAGRARPATSTRRSWTSARRSAEPAPPLCGDCPVRRGCARCPAEPPALAGDAKQSTSELTGRIAGVRD